MKEKTKEKDYCVDDVEFQEEEDEAEDDVLTRHSVAVEVISDGLLELMVKRVFLKLQAQVVLQVFVQFVTCTGKPHRNSCYASYFL